MAWRLPILISARTTLLNCHRGSFKFEVAKPKFGSLRIGLNDLEYSYDTRSFVCVEGEMLIKGSDSHLFGPGLSLNVWKNGTLIVGNNFSCAPHLRLFCSKKIIIGDDNMWSFYNLIMDTDAHRIYDESKNVINTPKEIEFGNHCWLGAYCKVLKGAIISGGCVIGMGSTVTKNLSKPNCIYLNNKVVRERVFWDRKLL